MLLHPETSGVEFGLRQAVNYVSGGYASVDPESRQRLEEQGYIVDGEAPSDGKLKSTVNQPVVFCHRRLDCHFGFHDVRRQRRYADLDRRAALLRDYAGVYVCVRAGFKGVWLAFNR